MKKGRSITLLSLICLVMAFLVVMTFIRFPVGVKNYNGVLGAIEKDYDIATKLQNDTDGNNAYLGYVGIYFPGTQYCQRHGLKCYDDNFYKMRQGIIDDVWDAIMNRADSTQYNWNQILALQARQKMLKMRRKSLALCPDCFELLHETKESR